MIDTNSILSPGNSTRTSRHWVDVVHSREMAWAILAISLIITIVAWQMSAHFAEIRSQERFDGKVATAQTAIIKRMVEYEQVLRSAVGFFKASTSVTRKEWHAFTETLQIEKYYPGIQGLGYAEWIKPGEELALEKRIRAEGFPDFEIKPPGKRDQMSSIIYLEPFTGRNLRAFGFDMYSEPTRRTAMNAARDSGEPMMSGKVTLVQETNKGVQAGFLLYLPLYSQASNTVEERRLNLTGFVYSPFRAGDLMNKLLGDHGAQELNFKIFDGETTDVASLLYQTDTDTNSPQDSVPSHSSTQHITVSGRPWTINFTTTAEFDRQYASSQPTIVAVGGIVIDTLLFAIILSLSTLRDKAQALAELTKSQLSEREEHFKAISENAKEGIVSTDSSGTITYVNRATCEIFGFDQSELLGKHASMLLPKQNETDFSSMLEKLLTSQQSNDSLVFDCQRKNGENFPLEISVAQWFSNGDKHFNAMMRDISERRRIERMKNGFISTVSHELRTPLTAIKGSLGIFAHLHNVEFSDKSKELIDIANRNIVRLTDLVNDILDIDSIEEGKLRLNIENFSINELMRQVLEINQGFASQHRVSLTARMDLDATIAVDCNRFHQIMANLVSNACKFSRAGQEVRITSTIKENMVTVTVTDRGEGIPDHFRPHVFQKFAQADTSDSRTKGGTGLGLSITKSLVEKMGGTINYTTTIGKGTSFYFTLPLAEAAQTRKSA